MPTVVEALTTGLEHQRAGRLAQAEAVYRAILAEDAANADALHLLGLAACQGGNPQAGLALIQQAIRVQPSLALFHNSMGNALQSQGRPADARFAFEWALRLQPDFLEAHVNLGNALQDLGQADQAVEHYSEALRLRPDLPEIHNNLGNALRALDLLHEAIASFHHALRLRPHYAEAYVNLAAALERQSRFAEAELCCRQALRLDPNLAPAYNNLAAALLGQQRFDKAEACCREALRLAPHHAEAHHNLGEALRHQGRMEAAIACYREALRLKPDLVEAPAKMAEVFFSQERFAEAELCCREALRIRPDALRYANLAAVLVKLARIEEAEICAREALRQDPRNAEAHRTLGNLYYAQRRLVEAAASYEAALRVRPDDAGTRWNRALLLLLTGDFARGWEEYEWRWRRQESPPLSLPQPLWDGAPLEGRRILLYAEQGLGDTIQFIRYVALVEAAGGRVLVECQPCLASLLANSPGMPEVIGCGAPLADIDVQAPLLSLPRIFGTNSSNIPAQVPYLAAEPDKVAHWREILDPIKGFRVGLVWAGNSRHPDDRHRSLAPVRLAPLLRVPGASFISLQKGPGSGSLSEDLPILDLPDSETIADAAAIMMNLDLVISVDTMPAHLAGALGRPVWTLLSFAADFRWLLDRADSPWYPTMRLFRQPRPGDWETVLETVAKELERAVGV